MLTAFGHHSHQHSAKVWHISGFRNKRGKACSMEFGFRRVSSPLSLTLKLLNARSTPERGPDPQI